MILIVWIVIGLALIIFLIFAGWPLYSTYRTRQQGADVREGDEYLAAKKEWQQPRPSTRTRRRPRRRKAVGRPASDGVTPRSGPAPTRLTTPGRNQTPATKPQNISAVTLWSPAATKPPR
jgi:hypothetical protein